MRIRRNNAQFHSIAPQDRCSKDYIKNIFVVVALSCIMVMASLVVIYLPVQDVKAQDSNDCNSDAQDCYLEDPGACIADYPGACGPRECYNDYVDICYNSDSDNQDSEVSSEGPGKEPNSNDCNIDTTDCSLHACIDDGTCDLRDTDNQDR
jgi:hypothetical protein